MEEYLFLEQLKVCSCIPEETRYLEILNYSVLSSVTLVSLIGSMSIVNQKHRRMQG